MPSNALLTQQELAEVTGLSDRTIRRKRDELDPMPGAIGRNGRPEPLYDVAKLPTDAQRKWARTEQRKVVELNAPTDTQMVLALTVPTGPNLSVEDRKEAARRFDVIEPLLDRAKYELLYTQYPRMSQVYDYLAAQHKVKVRTVYRWLQAYQAGGLPALVRRDRSDKGTSRVMTDAARELLVKLATPQKGVYGVLRVREMWRVYEEERVWRAAHVDRPMGSFERSKYERYLDEGGKLLATSQLPEISYETFRTWFNRIPEMLRTLARGGPEAYRNTQEPVIHRDIEAIDPLDYVVMDHRVLDTFCLVRDRGTAWRLVRPWLTAAIDMRTRKWLSWCIVEKPSSDSIATVLKRLFVDYGLPKALYWDNGRDFTCQWFEGQTRKERREHRIEELDGVWRGVLGTLDIRVHHAIAYNARAKIIEPNFNRISNVDRAQPEWCGNSPSARPERFDALMKAHEAWMKGERQSPAFKTIEGIATFYSAVIRDLNERPMDPGAEGMRKVGLKSYEWMSPGEAWEKLAPAVPRRDVPPEVLQMCFAKRRELTVRRGEVATAVNGRDYSYRMSDNSLALMRLNGKAVELAYDPLDMGEAAVYYEGRFFGLVRRVELRRMGEAKFVEDLQSQRAAKRQLTKAIQAVHGSGVPAPSYAERLARRAEVLPTRDVERPVIPAAIAGPVAAAAEAARVDRSFDAAAVDESAAPAQARPEEPADDEFDFFN